MLLFTLKGLRSIFVLPFACFRLVFPDCLPPSLHLAFHLSRSALISSSRGLAILPSWEGHFGNHPRSIWELPFIHSSPSPDSLASTSSSSSNEHVFSPHWWQRRSIYAPRCAGVSRA